MIRAFAVSSKIVMNELYKDDTSKNAPATKNSGGKKKGSKKTKVKKSITLEKKSLPQHVKESIAAPQASGSKLPG